jgi:nicotinate-nucleotide adenylyltransferase
LVLLATEGEPRLKPSDIEFRLPRPSYTVDTLAYLTEKYPQHEFILLMGSDSLQNLEKWKNFAYILRHFPIYVYLRQGHEHLPEFKEGHIRVFSAPYLPISATHIREIRKSGRSIRYLVPESVREEIERNGYYQ